MTNGLNARRAAVACVAIGLATLGLTACGSSAAKGSATSSARPPNTSVAKSSTAIDATKSSASAVPTVTTPATTVDTTSASAGPPAVAAKAAPNPCTLVTAANVSAALKSSVPPGLRQKVGLFDSCVYTHGSSGIVILVRTIDRATFDRSAKANLGGARPVSGVGDDAYNASGTLLVWQAGIEIGIQLEGGNDALTTEMPLAVAALARL